MHYVINSDTFLSSFNHFLKLCFSIWTPWNEPESQSPKKTTFQSSGIYCGLLFLKGSCTCDKVPKLKLYEHQQSIKCHIKSIIYNLNMIKSLFGKDFILLHSNIAIIPILADKWGCYCLLSLSYNHECIVLSSGLVV